MKIIDIGEASERLEELVDQAAAGESFIIAIDGIPMVQVEALEDLDRAEATAFESV